MTFMSVSKQIVRGCGTSDAWYSQGECGSRRKVGEKHYLASMTDELAKQIIDSLGNGKTQPVRAKQFGVSLRTIQGIDLGTRWKHLMTAEQIAERQRPKNRKLSRANVRAIKREKKLNVTAEVRAKKYGAHKTMVQQIDRGEKWSNVKTDDDEDFVGENHPCAKMDEALAQAILNTKLTTMTMPQRIEKFGVSVHSIQSILHGATWKHLQPQLDLAKDLHAKRRAVEKDDTNIPEKRHKNVENIKIELN